MKGEERVREEKREKCAEVKNRKDKAWKKEKQLKEEWSSDE